jgi:ethanolamine permease
MADIERPYRSPLGEFGAWLTVVIALVTLYMQFQDPAYRGRMDRRDHLVRGRDHLLRLHGRKTLVYSPEEDFAVKARAQAGLDRA